MARNISRFIDDEYIKIYYPAYIDSNIDGFSFLQFIDKAQSQNISEILGYNLLKKIQDDIITNSLTGEYLYLLENYIKPATALWAIYHSYPYIGYRATNKGIVKKTSEYSESSDIDEINKLRMPIRDEAEFATQNIYRYIINNQSSFPEYFQTTGIDQITPKNTIYTSGIVYKRGRNGGSPYNIDFRV